MNAQAPIRKPIDAPKPLPSDNFICTAYAYPGEAPEFACEASEDDAIEQCAALFSDNPRYPNEAAVVVLTDARDGNSYPVTDRFNRILGKPEPSDNPARRFCNHPGALA